MMERIIRDRVILEANIFLDYKTTVRGVSTITGISKSTIHKDFVENLKEIDLVMYHKVKAQLKQNKDERHIRGGQATKELYKNKKSR